jgi:hypothetical protein
LIATASTARRVGACCLAVSDYGGVTGCTGEEPAADPSRTTRTESASPSPTVNTEDVEAGTAALAAYRNYVKAYVTASNKGDYNAKLDKFVADPALLTVRQDLLIKFQQGLVTKGQPTSAPKVNSVDTSQRPFTAEIEDCFDGEKWDVVSKETGESVRTEGQATRYVVIAKAELFDDGQWRIREVNAQRSGHADPASGRGPGRGGRQRRAARTRRGARRPRALRRARQLLLGGREPGQRGWRQQRWQQQRRWWCRPGLQLRGPSRALCGRRPRRVGRLLLRQADLAALRGADRRLLDHPHLRPLRGNPLRSGERRP